MPNNNRWRDEQDMHSNGDWRDNRSGSYQGQGMQGQSDYGHQNQPYRPQPYGAGQSAMGGNSNQDYQRGHSGGYGRENWGEDYEVRPPGQGYGQGGQRNLGNLGGEPPFESSGRGGRYGGYGRPDQSGYGDYSHPGRGYGAGQRTFQSGNYGQRGNYGQSSNYDGQGQDRGFWDRATDEVSSWFGDDQAEQRRQMDRHRGRGPRNYSRSDDRIMEDVCDRLTADPMVDASEVEVQVSDAEVTLTGTVTSREQRRRAEDCVEDVSGVKHVQNNLRVQDQNQSSMSGMGTESSGQRNKNKQSGSTGNIKPSQNGSEEQSSTRQQH